MSTVVYEYLLFGSPRRQFTTPVDAALFRGAASNANLEPHLTKHANDTDRSPTHLPFNTVQELLHIFGETGLDHDPGQHEEGVVEALTLGWILAFKGTRLVSNCSHKDIFLLSNESLF